ncbi:ATP-binding cassette domain-containing protein [Streptomyces roseicoloratus]|uniref:ATP-binding cassette domain-containing protein n=1 Tax=Streptomyces roseicoloratus TaxID=2508722 RepID=A0ABY9RQI2_9ACTN|nr:ATP-binding cassette domain-containing protein [Streptomyces roseicoloratus]WMX44463.1 ATP-binding cassette domain-containing protein [Streptomyces roseicoloratus]
MILEGVGRRYGPRGPWVLREVGLTLPAGTLTRFTGGNGTGKSTLLRLVAGVDAPGAGRITGRPARTAYVPERFPAALPLTAADYLVHLGRIQGLGGREARARAAEWLERFGAAAHRDAPLAELSKGTSQKVAVAQALLAEPGLLVLDEAWTGLDTGARAALDRAVRERVAAGGRVVFVDHDPRRLAGEADAEYVVAEGGVRRAEPECVVAEGGVRRAEPEAPVLAQVRVTASGGVHPPPGIEGFATELPGGAGRLTVTVDAARSDEVLRTLLDAGWHVEDLRTTVTAARPEDAARATEGVRG